MARKSKAKLNTTSKMGGIPFYISLISLILLALVNASFFPFMFKENYWQVTLFLVSGLSVGGWITYAFISGAPSVFIHELKHSIMSNLAGNRAKNMQVKRKTGHFTFEYTAETAKYNALIALAPYFLPIFTFVSIIIVLAFLRTEHEFAVAVIALGFGADLVFNFRDVSPVQTDLTRLNGGYTVGVTFVVAMNFVMFSFLAIWAYGEWTGLIGLVEHFTKIAAALLENFKSSR